MHEEKSLITEHLTTNDPSVGRTLLIAAQLALLLGLLYLLEIEPATGLSRILPLIFAGFLIHAFLPSRYRLPFFLLISVATSSLILGPLASVCLIGIGAGLVGLCHLPVPFRVRVLLILVVGAGLAVVRSMAGSLAASESSGFATPGSLPALVLPVIGSMFMFRIIIYMYDLRHEETGRLLGKNSRFTGGADVRAASPWMRLAYFFLFPNVCFLLFPVVDYRTFRRTYYDTDAKSIYENGNWWIALSLAYFLAYRAVYHFLTPSPDEIVGVRAVTAFMISSYLVYLRVVGQFHLIIGMLCLFGFNLPPVHRFFLLSGSFTDFWRRARIDWKDFMVKVVYYPAVVPLQRSVGKLRALIVATIAVFVATWFLHSYQWFWLRGDFPVSVTDVVFWGIVGACVLVNSILEARGSAKRTVKGWNLRLAAIHSLRVLGIFLFFSVLWSYWSSPSIGSWLSIVGSVRESGAASYVKLGGIVTMFFAAGVIAQWIMHSLGSGPAAPRGPGGASRRNQLIPVVWRAPVITSLVALVLVAERPGAQLSAKDSIAKIANKLGTNTLNVADQTRLDRNYYDVLLDAPRATAGSGLANVGNSAIKETAPVEITRMEFVEHTHDLLGYGLKPSYSGIKYRGAPFRTNKWGMRDKDYSLVPPEGTYRFALLGASYEMASGVRMEDGFEWQLEDRLNRERPGNPERYEILNFSVGGYEILQNAILAERIFRFSPNAVIVAIKTIDSSRVVDHLVDDVMTGVPITYPYVRQKLADVDARPGDWRELRRRIAPISGDIVRWSLNHIAEVCRQHHVPAIALVMPRTSPRPGDDRAISEMASWATAAGFSVINLEGAFAGHPIDSIVLSRLDEHPTALGHKLLASRMYDLLTKGDRAWFSSGHTGRE